MQNTKYVIYYISIFCIEFFTSECIISFVIFFCNYKIEYMIITYEILIYFIILR